MDERSVKFAGGAADYVVAAAAADCVVVAAADYVDYVDSDYVAVDAAAVALDIAAAVVSLAVCGSAGGISGCHDTAGKLHCCWLIRGAKMGCSSPARSSRNWT